MSEPLRTVNVGLIGLGTVGGGVARLIKSHHDEYLAAYGIDLKLTRACALAWEQAEAAGIEREAFTSDWHDVVTDPAVDIVIELIGGEHPATEIFTTAFEHGKHVVSANKALLGRHVETLAEKARACGVQIKCEASCGGGIPIVSTLEHDLVGNKILTIAGILNGTTNYILSRMDAEGADYADVLADAQAKGYPEAKVWGRSCDLTSLEAVTEAFTQAAADMGGLDTVVNNAGISQRSPLLDYTAEEFAKVMDLNVVAVFNGHQAAAKIMTEAGHGGTITTTSSMVAKYGQPSGVGYPTSKFAVNGMVQSLSRELAPMGIRVNAVAPGVTKTDMVANLPDEVIKPIIATIPLGRMGEPEDIANAFVFLASDMSSYVTGAVLPVDGAARS